MWGYKVGQRPDKDRLVVTGFGWFSGVTPEGQFVHKVEQGKNFFMKETVKALIIPPIIEGESLPRYVLVTIEGIEFFDSQQAVEMIVYLRKKKNCLST